MEIERLIIFLQLFNKKYLFNVLKIQNCNKYLFFTTRKLLSYNKKRKLPSEQAQGIVYSLIKASVVTDIMGL